MPVSRSARRWVSGLFATLLALSLLASLGPARARADRSVFTEFVAFPIKTDFRVAVAWETSQPVEAKVRYGSTRGALTEVVQPAGIAAAPSQMAFVDVEPGQAVYVQVEDPATGDKTPVKRVVPANAYLDYDKKKRMYTINFAMWLDGEASPEAAPDADLELIAESVNVMAERVYDALDGSARVGEVLISDAPVGRSPFVRIPQSEENACFETEAVGADVIFMSAFPSSSEVNTDWAIANPCGVTFMGRVGPYGGFWRDELYLGGILTHELMHYAFGLRDLYGKPGGIEDGSAACLNEDLDMSMMNTAPFFSNADGRWKFTELDRNAEDTPCEHGDMPWSWSLLRERYRKVPDPAVNIPEGIVDTAAKGNPDGGALRIWVLDHEPGRGAKLTPYTPQD